MDPDNGSIEHLDIGISFIRYGSEDAVPDACLAPSVEAVVAGRIPPTGAGNHSPDGPKAGHALTITFDR